MATAALTAVGLALGALSLGGAALAASTHGPNLEVSVIQATVSDASLSIDSRLQDLATQLTTQQPFVRYRAFTLVSRTQLPLQPQGGKTITYALPTGQVLHASLDGTVRRRTARSATSSPPVASPADAGAPVNVQVTASANEPFFVGGQS